MNSQARFDYLRVSVGHDYDLAQQAYNYMRKLLEEIKAVQGVEGGFGYRPMYNSQTATREYFIDIWGNLAQAAVEIHSEYLAAFGLRRADVRMPLEGVTERGLKGLSRVLAGRPRGRRNVNVFNSATRSKEGGRHAGGTGVAIGSHKSEWRGSIYKRGSEPAAMEGQYQGAKLRDFCGRFLKYGDDPRTLRQQWIDLLDELAHDTEMRMMDMLGIESYELAAILRGEQSPLLVADDGDRFEQLSLLFDSLPPSQQRAWLAQRGKA
ncbi:MAG TPA: hypothetical protein VFG99_06080 [Chloroflexia bacterium]|nr:hypothetical protein [Chloroflexia bacterium]